MGPIDTSHTFHTLKVICRSQVGPRWFKLGHLEESDVSDTGINTWCQTAPLWDCLGSPTHSHTSVRRTPLGSEVITAGLRVDV